MDLMHRIPKLTESENQMAVKQFGASGNQSAVKKKALTDIKNTIHQKPLQMINGNKLHSNIFSSKDITAKPCNSKKEAINANKQEGKSGMKNLGSNTDTEDTLENAEECVCTGEAVDIPDDMFYGLKLTKTQIENLALNWEPPRVYGKEDVRDLMSLIGPAIKDDFMIVRGEYYDGIEEDFTPPDVPSVYLDDAVNVFSIDSGIDCSIGL